MWSLSKVIHTPECLRVYIGSFWDEPYKNLENEKLFKAEQDDLYNDLGVLPRNSTVRKVNELVKRARQLRCHMLILGHLKKQVPTFGREKRQKELIANLAEEFKVCRSNFTSFLHCLTSHRKFLVYLKFRLEISRR